MIDADFILVDVTDPEAESALRDAFEERAAICEFDGNMDRDRAEQLALAELRDAIVAWEFWT